MSFIQQLSFNLALNLVLLLFCYILFVIYRIKLSKDPRIPTNSNSIESRFIQKFVEQYKGYPEITETDLILNEIKLNNTPEQEWEEVFKKHAFADQLIQERYGRGRLAP